MLQIGFGLEGIGQKHQDSIQVYSFPLRRVICNVLKTSEDLLEKEGSSEFQNNRDFIKEEIDKQVHAVRADESHKKTRAPAYKKTLDIGEEELKKGYTYGVLAKL
jgi:hypothetical protein